MSAVHDPECEKAEPGSLCDCDCAGARHAVRNTPGGTPQAGAVSRRARKIAERDGRAPVINRLPGTGTTRRRARPAADPVRPEPAKPDPVRLSDPPAPRLSAAVKAQLRQVRAALPKTRDQWHAAATEPLPAARLAELQQRVDKLQGLVDDADRQRQAASDRANDAYARTFMATKDFKRGLYGSREDFLRHVKETAFHRAYDDPEWNRLNDEHMRLDVFLDSARRDLERETVRRVYPADPSTGLRMPTKALNEHLAAVRELGRNVLADARRAWEKDPPKPVRDAADMIAAHAAAVETVHAFNRRIGRRDKIGADGQLGRFTVPLPGGGTVTITSREQFDALERDAVRAQLGFDQTRLKEARRTVAKHQADTLRAVLASARTFGGRHSDVTAERDAAASNSFDPRAPRDDWRARLEVAEDHFPADWITASSQRPLRVGASGRAYYSSARGLLSMNIDDRGDGQHDGALDYVDEVTVHEMGHRMEYTIPGLTHLEFAYVRERGVDDKGRVERPRSLGYQDASEVAQWDRWGHAYAGKTYEARNPSTPGDNAWEVFQVGLQDTFGRSTRYRYGPTDDHDELQAFVVGALLALG